MVGLVIVSHSRQLAEAVADLIKTLSSIDIPIAISGGVGNNYSELGTDATDIMMAIESVHNPSGTLVLVDMGSAILSTELACELLSSDSTSSIKIASAPLVEGAVAAAVQIALNAPLENVYTEAMAGLKAKQQHLNHTENTTIDYSNIGITLAENPYTIHQDFIIANAYGLHARPIAQLIQGLASFSCQIGIQNTTKNSEIISSKSAIALGCLQLLKGENMRVYALGEDAQDALEAVEKMHRLHFGDSPNIDRTEEDFNHLNTKTISLSEGYALATAFSLSEQTIIIEKENNKSCKVECEKLKKAVIETVNQLSRHIEKLGKIEGDILAAQRQMLQDPILIDKAKTIITTEKCQAAYAWQRVIQELSSEYRHMDDLYFRQRAIDITDIGTQVLITLKAIVSHEKLPTNKPIILFLKELSPNIATELDPNIVKGVVTQYGGTNSHAAIITRSLGIPCISGYQDWINIKTGDFVIVDGYRNVVHVCPSKELVETYQRHYENWRKTREQLKVKAQRVITTKDGHKFNILANIGSTREAQLVCDNGADGIGLLRTEFLFLDNNKAPSEEEQYQLLHGILIKVKKPTTIRTFDIGGDKQVPYVNQEEKNPFLGVRGIRLYQQEPRLFNDHIRAILRASYGTEAKIMFPMVSTVAEFLKTQQRVTEIHNKLSEENITHQWPISMGIMIETPAAVLLANEFAQIVDFFSIGTNDLTQYTMAADRESVVLSDYTNPLNLPVLRMIDAVIIAAKKHHIPVSLCGNPGELKTALPILIGLGLHDISLSLQDIPQAKQIVTTIDARKLMQKKATFLSSSI